MSAPVLDDYSAELYAAVAPVAGDDVSYGYPLAWFCAAIGTMFQPVAGWVRDTADGTGFSNMLDVDRAPVEALGWLAQFVGVQLDPALNEATQRQRIRETAGMKRGTPAAIIGAAQQYLTGQKRVFLTERAGGDAYALNLITYASETPDSAAVLAAVMAQKPAGIALTYSVLTGQTFAQLKANYATFAAVKAAYPTFAAVRDDAP